MKSSLRFIGGCILTVLLAVFLTACGGHSNSGEVVANYTVSGTITLPNSVINKEWLVAIDNDLDGSNGMIAHATGVVTGSTFTYSININDVPTGEYYVWAEVALVGSLGPVESGDYLGFACGTISSPCKVQIYNSISREFDFTLAVYP